MAGRHEITRSTNRAVYVISVAAELAGVHPQTLRIYERKGLLDPARTEGGSRRYSERRHRAAAAHPGPHQRGLNLAGVKRVMELEDELARLQSELDGRCGRGPAACRPGAPSVPPRPGAVEAEPGALHPTASIMTACPSCGFDNPAAFRFCGSCGDAIGGRSCPSCGAATAAGLHFCGQCGTALDVAITTVGLEERKLATVLYADVVGFTSLSETADPELVARTVDAAFRRLADVVDAHGGTVDKYVGDCLMAVFGVPVAHDDDAERAVAAGLAMRGLSQDLEFSIGINTGEVMVTAIGAKEGVTVVGDTVNVAARLEKAAGADEVLVGQLTAQLAAGQVSFCERSPMVLKGKREPVPVFEAIRCAARATVPTTADPSERGVHLSSDATTTWRSSGLNGAAGPRRASCDGGDAHRRRGGGQDPADRGARRRRGARGAGGANHLPRVWRARRPRVAADIIRQLGVTGQSEIDARARSLGGAVDPTLRALGPRLHWRRSSCGPSAGCSRRRAQRAPCCSRSTTCTAPARRPSSSWPS